MLERSIEFFRPHHQELRGRLVKIFISIIVCTCLAYSFSETLADFFTTPLFSASPYMDHMVYTNLPEAFLAYLKLSILMGLLFSFPVILYQIWAFIAPGMHTNEKKLTITIVFWGTLLFAVGSCFALFGVIPKMLTYFMSYAHENLEPVPKFGKFLTFVIRTIFACGLAFQIPFLMVMAGKANLVKATYFRAKRIYFYAMIIFLSFLLTAGDFMATALLAIPLFALYESGITLLKLFIRPPKETEEL
jgi:sec-independent protein translocase protein TatC